VTLASAIADFLRLHLQAERNASPHTLRNYGVDLRQFAAFCGPERQLISITHTEIRDFLADLYARGCGKPTAARHLSAIRSLFRYAVREGWAEANPAKLLSSPKLGRHLPGIPSLEQVNRFLDQPRSDDCAWPEREQLLLELLYGSGLRVSELTALNLGDVDPDEALLRVTGKGRKQRLVPFGRRAAAALATYLEQRRALPPVPRDNPALLLNQRGRRLTARSVGRIVKALALRFGLPLDLHPHTLRHAFASHLLGEGADLRAIQEMLGHASLATTQRYTHTDIRQLTEVYDRAHPFERDAKPAALNTRAGASRAARHS